MGDEDKTMNEYWGREIDSVNYFNSRFEKRFEESQALRAKMDQEERNRIQREEKKEKKEDEFRLINEEYNTYSESFLNEFVYMISPEEKEPNSPKQKK